MWDRMLDQAPSILSSMSVVRIADTDTASPGECRSSSPARTHALSSNLRRRFSEHRWGLVDEIACETPALISLNAIQRDTTALNAGDDQWDALARGSLATARGKAIDVGHAVVNLIPNMQIYRTS